MTVRMTCLVVLGMVAAACSVAPTPSGVPASGVAATSPAASGATPIATDPADPTSLPVPDDSPLAVPTRTPMPLKGFGIVLPGPPDDGVELWVRDWSGHLAGVEQADRSLVDLPDPGPHGLAIGPGTSDRRITVAWTGGVCDTWLYLDIAADGRTLTLREPRGPGCDAIGIGRSVELRFESDVDPSVHVGTMTRDALAVGDINPTVVAFADALHGWIGGRTERGEAVIEETFDGGASWTAAILGQGAISDLAVAGDVAVAGLVCAEADPGCDAGLYRLDRDGEWAAVSGDVPVALDFVGNDGIGAFLVPGRTTEAGMPRPEVRVTEDGFNWTAVDDPCGRLNLDDVALGPDAMPLALCSGQGGGGGQRKAIYRANAAGQPWEIMSTTESGGLPVDGTGVRFDVSASVTGWMWGTRTTPLVTRDGGRTWRAVPGLADGEIAIAVGVAGVEDTAAFALVVDPNRDATILSWTRDGLTWQERFAWPIHATCCG